MAGEVPPGRDHEAYRLYEMVQSLFNAPPDGDEVLLQLGAQLEPVLTPPDFFQEAAADTKL